MPGRREVPSINDVRLAAVSPQVIEGADPFSLDHRAAQKFAHCFRDLGDDTRTATYAAQSLDMADGYLRGRSFNLCLLAGAHARHDPLEAVRVGRQAADIIDGLGSRRSHSYLRAVRHRLAAHDDIPDVAAFRARVAAITART